MQNISLISVKWLQRHWKEWKQLETKILGREHGQQLCLPLHQGFCFSANQHLWSHYVMPQDSVLQHNLCIPHNTWGMERMCQCQGQTSYHPNGSPLLYKENVHPGQVRESGFSSFRLDNCGAMYGVTCSDSFLLVSTDWRMSRSIPDKLLPYFLPYKMHHRISRTYNLARYI